LVIQSKPIITLGMGVKMRYMFARLKRVWVPLCLSAALISLAYSETGQDQGKSTAYVTADGHFNVKRFLRDTRDEDTKISTEAFEAQKRVGPKAIPDFFAYLESDSTGFPQRDSYAESALTMYGAAAKPFLLEAILKGPKLTSLIGLQTIQSLLRMQIDPNHIKGGQGTNNGEERWIYDREVKDALLDCCDDFVPNVRAVALRVCGDFKYSGATRSAEKALADKALESFVRWEAVLAILKFESPNLGNLMAYGKDLFEEKITSSDIAIYLGQIQNDSTYNSFCKF
jgi:hypothetical protein